jgi:LysM repeat protein
MSYKTFTRSVVLVLFALAALVLPLNVHAGGACGGTYTADPGDTVEKLAAMCGTSAAAIYAANPGISNVLSAGQVLTIPGSSFVTPVPSTPAPITVVPVTVNNYNYYNYYNYYPPTSYTNTYVVQYGDTFASIAYRFGVGLHDLWAANPQIHNINLIYVGQVINVPARGTAVSTEEATPLSYPGDIPKNASKGTVVLVNNSNSDVYISLRTARADGTNAINEYPVGGTLTAKIPSGWIDYVAWVGGVKYTGGFQLKADTQHTITFNRSKVIVE